MPIAKPVRLSVRGRLEAFRVPGSLDQSPINPIRVLAAIERRERLRVCGAVFLMPTTVMVRPQAEKWGRGQSRRHGDTAKEERDKEEKCSKKDKGQRICRDESPRGPAREIWQAHGQKEAKNRLLDTTLAGLTSRKWRRRKGEWQHTWPLRTVDDGALEGSNWSSTIARQLQWL